MNKIVWNTIFVNTIVIYWTVHNLSIIQMYFFIFFFGADFINLFTSNILLKFVVSCIRFLWKDLEVLEKWLETQNLRDWHPNNLNVLCSSHFKDECFDRTGFRVSLKKGSIPTKFGDPASCCIFCRRKRTSDTENCFYKLLSRNEKDHFERNDRNIENFEIYHFFVGFQWTTRNSWMLGLTNSIKLIGDRLKLQFCAPNTSRSHASEYPKGNMPLKTNSVATIFDTENVSRNGLQNEGKPPIWLQYWQYSEIFFFSQRCFNSEDVFFNSEAFFSIAKRFFSTAKNFFNSKQFDFLFCIVFHLAILTIWQIFFYIRSVSIAKRFFFNSKGSCSIVQHFFSIAKRCFSTAKDFSIAKHFLQ